MGDDDLPVVRGTQVAPTSSELVAVVEAALSQPLRIPGVSVVYGITLFVLGALAVLLPALYIALPLSMIAGGLLLGVSVFDGMRFGYAMFLLLGLAVGLLLSGVSLLAPLLARSTPPDLPSVVVTRQSEPVVFHVIDAVARVLGVRGVDEVRMIGDANAAVVFTDGRNVLLLGMPLLACATVGEFAGLLGHELGHVRQGWARRFVVGVVRVHRWFGTALEGIERAEPTGINAVDAGRGLAFLSASLVLGLVLRGSAALVWVLAREMELDADRCEAKISGPAAFASLSEKLSAAAVVLAKTFDDVQAGARCPDNLSRWVAWHVERMPVSERRRWARRLTRDAAGVPHPPHDVRVEAARKVGGAGILTSGAPAVALFRSFDAYATRVTRETVVGVLPAGSRLHPVEELLARVV